MPDPPLGDELRDRRLAEEWTQPDLAERLPVATATPVSAWENNHHDPSTENAAALVELLGESDRSASLAERRASDG